MNPPNPEMTGPPAIDKRCEVCSGGGWLTPEGMPFFDPEGEHPDWLNGRHQWCPSCLSTGESIEFMESKATPGLWNVDWDSCDCGGGYPCSHPDWVYGINDVILDDITPEDFLYMISLVNREHLRKAAADDQA